MLRKNEKVHTKKEEMKMIIENLIAISYLLGAITPYIMAIVTPIILVINMIVLVKVSRKIKKKWKRK